MTTTTHPLAVRARRRLEVRTLITTCHHCELRDRIRPHPVPFAGPLHPHFIVLGEAPGQTEQRRQVPFIGLSGRLLRRLLTEAGLPPDEALFVNTVCCNPGRAPDRAHMDACRPNLDAQLDLAEPDTPLLACGQIALSALVPDGTVRQLQGHALVLGGRPVMPVYHPAYLSRDPTAKPGVVEALGRFRAVVSGLDPDFFTAGICCMCAEVAVEWDDRKMPYCRKHKVEIRRNVNRATRRRKAENRAAQQRMELT